MWFITLTHKKDPSVRRPHLKIIKTNIFISIKFLIFIVRILIYNLNFIYYSTIIMLKIK